MATMVSVRRKESWLQGSTEDQYDAVVATGVAY